MMRKAMQKTWLAAAILVSGLLAGAPAAHASFTALASPDAAYCAAGMDCSSPGACSVEQLGLDSLGCSIYCAYPDCDFFEHQVDAYAQTAAGYMPYMCLFGGICGFSAQLYTRGGRVNGTTLNVMGDYFFEPEFPCAPVEGCGSAEAAVIRYSGDPAAFEGFFPKSVHDLVAAGLIDETDILFLKDDFPGFAGGSVQFSATVDVRGIQNRDIYVFSTLQVPAPEPSGAAMLLVGAMTLHGLRKMQRRGTPHATTRAPTSRCLQPRRL
jgi:hypothetical protein